MTHRLGFMRGNVLVMTICECVWRSTVDIIWPFLSLYVLELGGSYQTIGLIMSGASLGSMLLYPLGGYITDYQGRIKLIGYMTFVYAAAFLIPGLGDSWQWLAIGIFVQNMTTFYWPAIQALLADSIQPESRGVGYAAFEAIPSAFGLAAPIAGAWLIGLFGMRSAMRGLFLASFAIASSIALFRLKFLRETVKSPQKLDVSLKGVLRLLADSYKGIFNVFSGVTHDLLILSLLVTALIFSASFANNFWVIRATEVVGLSLGEWAAIIMASGAVRVFLGLPAGHLVDRFSKRKVAGSCILLGALFSFLFLRAGSFTDVAILSMVTAVVDAFLNPALRSLFADLTPRAMRGRVMALLGGGGLNLMRGVYAASILGKIFQTSGTFLSGYVYSFDNSLPWLILSASMAVIGVVFFVLVKDPQMPEV